MVPKEGHVKQETYKYDCQQVKYISTLAHFYCQHKETNIIWLVSPVFTANTQPLRNVWNFKERNQGWCKKTARFVCE